MASFLKRMSNKFAKTKEQSVATNSHLTEDSNSLYTMSNTLPTLVNNFQYDSELFRHGIEMIEPLKYLFSN